VRTLGLILFWVSALPAVEIKGRVIDANTGEPLARVLIRGAGNETLTASDGAFELDINSFDEVELQVSSVNYRPFKTRVNSGQASALEIVLVPDTLRRTDQLEVTAGPYAVEEQGTALSLAGSELRNLSSVLTDDPLRAVHGLPGVNPNDDFQSQFSMRGAAYNRLGVYIDGILLHSHFHTLQADPSSASVTILNGDVMESAVLHPGGAPARFADRTAGILDQRVREGNRDRMAGRISASASNATATVDGPFGKKGSWLASARKSYLQYIVDVASTEDSVAFGFSDAQARAAYDLGRDHTVSLSLVDGRSGLDRSGAENQIGLNTVFLSDYHFTLAALRSRWAPGRSIVLNHSVAWMRERFLNQNRERLPLAEGFYGEWVANADHAWEWRSGSTLLFGGVIRRLRDDGYLSRRVTSEPFVLRLFDYRGNAWRGGSFFAQHFSVLQGRMQLRAGARLDGDNINGRSTISPSAGVTFFTGPRTQFHLDWGMAAQQPEISQYLSSFGSPQLLPERSIHWQVAAEHRLDTRTRLRVEAYQRLDRDLLFRPLFEPRLVAGQVFPGLINAPVENALRGYARGMQVVVQRRTSNGLTGWAGYAYGVSRLRGELTGPAFDSDFDQRHTAHLYLSYRLRPTLNLGGRWVYGSGFPVRGYFAGAPPSFVLAEQRNRLRLPAYHRTDVRVAKTIVRDGWHLTIFGEVINLFNQDNVRQDDPGGFNPQTGTVRLRFETLLPVIPSAGVAVEF
jgi:hypothetical protein